MTLDQLPELSASLAGLMILISLVVSAIRLLLGPSLPDRVMSLDLISMLLVAFLLIFAATSRVEAYLDAALVLALVAFLATVAFARYIERIMALQERRK